MCIVESMYTDFSAQKACPVHVIGHTNAKIYLQHYLSSSCILVEAKE